MTITDLLDSTRSDRNVMVYLLGSRAQGSSTEKSDIDILIFHQNIEAKSLSKSLKNEYCEIAKKLNLKILNYKELNKVRNEQYFGSISITVRSERSIPE